MWPLHSDNLKSQFQSSHRKSRLFGAGSLSASFGLVFRFSALTRSTRNLTALLPVDQKYHYFQTVILPLLSRIHAVN